jgi:hypothetical protein
MNIYLYSFVFYKTQLPSNEYLLYLKHNYYYLSGLNNAITAQKKVETPVEVKPRNELDVKLKELENKIDEKINKNIQENSLNKTNVEYHKISQLEIPPIKNTEGDNILTSIF